MKMEIEKSFASKLIFLFRWGWWRL